MFFSFLSIVHSEEIINEDIATDINYYNMIKLFQPDTSLYLSSIFAKYLNGSNQGVVRGIEYGPLSETFWIVEPTLNQTDISQSTILPCRQAFRLKNAYTHLYLHSHDISAQNVIGNEVSCFEGNDSGDLWMAICDDVITDATEFSLQHVDTKYYLSATKNYKYLPEEGGQYEIFTKSNNESSMWRIRGGIFTNFDS